MKYKMTGTISLALTGLLGCGETETSSTPATLQSTTLDAYDQIASKITALQEYAAQAASDTETDENRAAYQLEVDTLLSEIDEISDTTAFSDRKPLLGSNPTQLSNEGTFSVTGNIINKIKAAIDNLDEGNQSVEITYSFVLSGVEVVEKQTTYSSVEMKDYVDGSVTHAEFQQDISEALTLWEEAFERTFNPTNGYGASLEVDFTNLGDETGVSQSVKGTSGAYAVPGSENLGMLRYVMAGIGTTAGPYSPTGNTSDGIDDSSGDICFDSTQNWRQDRDEASAGSPGSTAAASVMIVAAHEIGHGFGFNHDETSTSNMMNPANITTGSVEELFPDGIYEKEGSSEVLGLVYMYGADATYTDTDPYSINSQDVDLPTINTASLEISAIKVRTQVEAALAEEQLEAAATTLSNHRATMAAY